MIYRTKPVRVEAVQWFRVGDHSAVCRLAIESPTGWLSREVSATFRSQYVHPGDWIVTDAAGQHSVVKPDVFAATYEPVEDGEER